MRARGLVASKRSHHATLGLWLGDATSSVVQNQRAAPKKCAWQQAKPAHKARRRARRETKQTSS